MTWTLLPAPGRMPTRGALQPAVAPEAGPESYPPPGTAPAPPPDPRYPPLFRTAAQLIRELGWGQGADLGLGDRPGICAGYALYLAALDVTADCPDEALIDGARSWLSSELLAGQTIPRWNDRPGRTADDVTGTLDRAAALAERAA